MSVIRFSESALIIVDVQRDFCPGGTMAVPEGDQVVPEINAVSSRFPFAIATQDWHPEEHISFASAHPGKEPYQTIPWKDQEQMLWPDHCVAGAPGAAFHPDLDTTVCSLIIRKGRTKTMDSYSAFFENDHATPTGLAGYLKTLNIESVVICGLASDYCVFFTAMDAVSLGLKTAVLKKAVRGVGVPEGNVERTRDIMQQAGVYFI